MELEVDFTRSWNNDAGQHTTTLVIGRVKMLYIREDLLDENLDIVSGSNMTFVSIPDKIEVQNLAALLPVSRFSGKLYSRSTQ